MPEDKPEIIQAPDAGQQFKIKTANWTDIQRSIEKDVKIGKLASLAHLTHD